MAIYDPVNMMYKNDKITMLTIYCEFLKFYMEKEFVHEKFIRIQ